jgi:hypothetical protein
MNIKPLNASAFIENCCHIYKQEFENILVAIINCYKLMIACKIVLFNDENEIRNKLVGNKFLSNNQIRKKLGITDYLFEPEAPEKSGRADIKIISKEATFRDTQAYYIIECKRLDNKNTTGTTGLNAKYIDEGIARFASKKYSMYDGTAGMIGFVVEKMDIQQNVSAINTLLTENFSQISTDEILTNKTIVSDFKYSYFSRHKIDDVVKIIYHLMFDFSDNITV